MKRKSLKSRILVPFIWTPMACGASEGVGRPTKGRIALNLRKPARVAVPSSKSAAPKPNPKKPTLVPKDRR